MDGFGITAGEIDKLIKENKPSRKKLFKVFYVDEKTKIKYLEIMEASCLADCFVEAVDLSDGDFIADIVQVKE